MIVSGITGTPLPLIKDGDLSAAIHSMFWLRGNDTVKVSKVKGHATQAMVDNVDARHEDLIGNDGAGRAVIQVRRRWYPIMLELQKKMVAISRIEVNHDGNGGTAPDATMWDKGCILKPRASSLRVIVDHASLPSPQGFWTALGVACPAPITQEDVAVWPYRVSISLDFSSFLTTLH